MTNQGPRKHLRNQDDYSRNITRLRHLSKSPPRYVITPTLAASAASKHPRQRRVRDRSGERRASHVNDEGKGQLSAARRLAEALTSRENTAGDEDWELLRTRLSLRELCLEKLGALVRAAHGVQENPTFVAKLHELIAALRQLSVEIAEGVVAFEGRRQACHGACRSYLLKMCADTAFLAGLLRVKAAGNPLLFPAGVRPSPREQNAIQIIIGSGIEKDADVVRVAKGVTEKWRNKPSPFAMPRERVVSHTRTGRKLAENNDYGRSGRSRQEHQQHKQEWKGPIPWNNRGSASGLVIDLDASSLGQTMKEGVGGRLSSEHDCQEPGDIESSQTSSVKGLSEQKVGVGLNHLFSVEGERTLDAKIVLEDKNIAGATVGPDASPFRLIHNMCDGLLNSLEARERRANKDDGDSDSETDSEPLNQKPRSPEWGTSSSNRSTFRHSHRVAKNHHRYRMLAQGFERWIDHSADRQPLQRQLAVLFCGSRGGMVGWARLRRVMSAWRSYARRHDKGTDNCEAGTFVKDEDEQGGVASNSERDVSKRRVGKGMATKSMASAHLQRELEFAAAKVITRAASSSQIALAHSSKALIMTATSLGDVKLLKFLLDRNAGGANVRGDGGVCPLHICIATAGEGCEERLQCAASLIEAGASLELRDNNGLTPLLKAALEGDALMVACLLEAGADATAVQSKGMRRPVTVLAAQCATPSAATLTLEILLKTSDCPSHMCMAASADNFTALHEFAARNNASAVRLLLEAGARADLALGDGLNALQCAAISGAFDVIELLLTSEFGSAAAAAREPQSGNTALDFAILSGDARATAILRARTPAQPLSGE